ncbi:MAG: protease, partial [Halobacteriaceae archaeon]
MALLSLVSRVLLSALILGSLVAVRRLDRSHGEWIGHLRTRFVLGIPWGTATISLIVLSVYLFIQNGASDWYSPLTIPFTSWSYLYPTGVILAPFSHMGPGHLLGNLFGTLIIAPIAEYTWSHFPRR